MVTSYGTDKSGFESGQEEDIFCSLRPPTQGPKPHIQTVPGVFPGGVSRPGREADHSSPSSAKIKNEWNCTSDTPPSYSTGSGGLSRWGKSAGT